jgi:hypothetical protein
MFRPVKQFRALTVYDRATMALIYSAAQLAVERGFQFTGRSGEVI